VVAKLCFVDYRDFGDFERWTLDGLERLAGHRGPSTARRG